MPETVAAGAGVEVLAVSVLVWLCRVWPARSGVRRARHARHAAKTRGRSGVGV